MLPVDFIAMIGATPNALFPAIAESFGGAKTLGMLCAASAAGGVAVSIFSGWTTLVKQETKAIAIAAILWGGAVIGFGLSNSYRVSLFFLVLAGAFDAISGIFRRSLWNSTIPHEYRGRLAGIEMISYVSGPNLGNMRAGLVAATFGITTAVVSGGVLCILGVTICCWKMPKFWQYRSNVNGHSLQEPGI